MSGARPAPDSPTAIASPSASSTVRDTARATPAQPTGQDPATESGRFASQLTRGLSAALAQSRSSGRPSEVTIRLQPATLGHLRIKIAFDAPGSGISANFEVGSPEARRLLGDSLPGLRTALESRGLDVSALDIQLADRSPIGHDPLGLVAGTPYAKHPEPGHSADAPPNPGHESGLNSPPGDFSGLGADSGGDGAAAGQDAHHGWAGASTDAPAEELIAAERLIQGIVGRTPITLSRDQGGALRLAVDAIA